MNNLLEIVHDVSMAEDFYFRWRRENPDGSLGAQLQSTLYRFDDLSGIWN